MPIFQLVYCASLAIQASRKITNETGTRLHVDTTVRTQNHSPPRKDIVPRRATLTDANLGLQNSHGAVGGSDPLLEFLAHTFHLG